MANFYETNQLNQQLFNNQYIIIKDIENNIVDTRKYIKKDDKEEFLKLKKNTFTSNLLGKIKPKDVYQECLIDALLNNINNNCNVTTIKGKAGSGKTFFALHYCFWGLENGTFDKIYIAINPAKANNSVGLGFYPGTKDEKLGMSGIGNILSSKLGSKTMVDELIKTDKIELLPICDIRGFETRRKSVLYLPESQNLDIYLMQLTLQRVGEETKVIIDGDIDTQVDNVYYEGEKNGMRRVSEIFKGSDIYNEVTLKNIYRSAVGVLADKM